MLTGRNRLIGFLPIINYRAVLGKKDLERMLDLAVPQDTYDRFFYLNLPKFGCVDRSGFNF